jgi:hypothetical protein
VSAKAVNSEGCEKGERKGRVGGMGVCIIEFYLVCGFGNGESGFRVVRVLFEAMLVVLASMDVEGMEKRGLCSGFCGCGVWNGDLM